MPLRLLPTGLFAALLGAATPTFGATFLSCFANFSALSEHDPKAQKLVAATYDALLDLPKDAVLKLRLLKAIEMSGDPFAIPEGEGELLLLRKRMGEFSKMLDHLGWDPPAMRELLLATARRRASALANAQGKLPTAIVANRRDFEFPLKGAIQAIQTKDGRYLIGDVVRNGYPTFTILDTVSGVATDYSMSSPLTGRPRLNSDGTKLYFTETYRLMVHDLKDGKPTGIAEVGKLGFWNKWMGSGMGNHFDRPEPLQNPNWVVTNFNDKKGLHLYDLEKKTFWPLRGTEAVDYRITEGGHDNDWGVVQGTNDLVVLKATDGQIELKKASVTPNGKLGAWKVLASWVRTGPAVVVQLGVAANKNFAVVKDIPAKGDLTVVSLKDGSRRNLSPFAPNLIKNLGLIEILLHPNGSEMAIICPDIGNNRRLHWFNVESGSYGGTFTLPYSGTARLSADGESLLVTNEKSVQVFNFRGRLNAGGSP